MKLLLATFLFVGLFTTTVVAQEEEETQFGEEITMDGAMSFTDFYDQMKEKEEMEVKIKGEVTGVCQKKGCWMTMEEDGKELFIKFKDYGFFVPKTISGRTAVIDGKAFREVVSVDEQKHMAEDAGKSEEEIAKITEPKEELRFMANGVLLLPAEE
jgi:hypothetical protein